MVHQDSGKTDAQSEIVPYLAAATPTGISGMSKLGERTMSVVDLLTRTSTQPVAATSTPISLPSRGRLLAMSAGLAVQFGVILACAARHVAVTSVGLLAVGLLLGLAAHVDVIEHRIPNHLLSWSVIAVLVVTAFSGPEVLDDVVLGTLLAFVPIAVVLLTRGVGTGDVKMAAVLGAAGGLIHPLVGLATVFLMALTTGLVGLTTKHKRLALGPWLWGSFLIASSFAAIVLHLQTAAS
jgi:Flp pilus assembly protein protease CpaA